jgi:choline-sulfatase
MLKNLIAAGLILLILGCSEEYNVVIIGLDAARPDHMSGFSDGANTTPSIARFSQAGFVFENAVSQSPWTLPSFASIFTGLYPNEHGLTNRYNIAGDELIEASIPEGLPTLAMELKQAGYYTAAFTGNAGLNGRYGFSRGFDHYFDNVSFAGFETTVPMALEYLENAAEPFMLFVHGYEAHGKHQSGTGFSAEDWLAMRNASIYKQKLPAYSQSEWYAWYDEKLRLMDANVAPLLAALEAREDTIVVILSDHGDGFGEHESFDHGLSLYDELVHVCLVIKAPFIGNGRISQQVRLIDVAPTILDLVGRRRIGSGTSLVPAMRGKQLGLDAFIETDYLYNFFFRGLRTHDGYKLIYNLETDGVELYNLAKDPKEQVNIAEQEPVKLAELKRKLFSY